MGVWIYGYVEICIHMCAYKWRCIDAHTYLYIQNSGNKEEYEYNARYM